MPNKTNERRSLIRLPFMMKFRLRNDTGSKTYQAKSCDIHPCGIQIETRAPVTPRMEVELWSEDYTTNSCYVHGEVSWVKPMGGGDNQRCGITFSRKIDWPIPLPVLTKSYIAPSSSTHLPTELVLDSIVDGVFSVDDKWRITSFNSAAEKVTGWKREDAIGKTCKEVFKSNCCGKECVLAESIRLKKPVLNKSLLITHISGQRVDAVINATPLFDKNGTPLGGVQVFRNAEATQERGLILDNLGDGVFTVDTRWRITSFNRAAERITGFSREEAIGKSCSDIFQASICGESCAIAHSISTGKPETNHCIYIHNIDKAKIPVSICATPMYDSDGNLIGGVETLRDLRFGKARPKTRCCQDTFGDFISKSMAMKKIFDIMPNIAKSESNVLILGESGTGKELVAQSLHDLSERRQGPFVVVNCSALPDTLLESELFGSKAGAYTDSKKDREGRFAAAEGGTLFLDEIGDISLAMQVKLLRVLETKSYEPLGSNLPVKANVRIVVATNRDLEKLVAEGRFRDDLFYRLNVVKLTLPPLRDRLEDVPLLTDYFVGKLNMEKHRDIGGATEEVLRILLAYDYPGNVRELQNILEYSFILCPGGMIQPEHLPSPLAPRTETFRPVIENQGPLPLAELEKRAIGTALQRNSWKRMATCRELGISKDTLRRKISQYGFMELQESEAAQEL